ncbi:MAG: radical SAM protein [Candidatus Omnitrophica bacterium]|nr:radical SAM protein [Candidatus Omnitrophota bacterium]
MIDALLRELENNGIPSLHSVSLEVTTRCNLKCLHCYLSYALRHEHFCYLDIESLKNILPTLSKRGCRNISLIGGEPLLHPHIDEIIYLCKSSGFDITIYTNATLIDEKAVRLFRTHPITRLIITFYGSSNDDYRKLSVNNEEHLFTAIIEGLKYLKAYHIPYKLQAFLLRGNLFLRSALERILPEEKHIAEGFTVIPRSAIDRTNQNVMIPVSQISNIIRPSRKYMWGKAEWLKQFLYKNQIKWGCTAGLLGINITADFKIRPCVFIQDPDLSFSLDDYSFEDIFFKKMKMKIICQISYKSPCYHCNLRYFCCRCVALGYGMELNYEDDRVICQMAKAVKQKSNEAQ